MQSAVRQTVRVQSGGVVELRAPELSEGSMADVIVLVDAEAQSNSGGLSRFIGAAKGGFATPDEADAFIKPERDEWTS